MRVLAAVGFALVAALTFAQKMPDQDKKELSMLKQLEAKQVKAAAAFKKTPKDAKVKSAFIGASMSLADAVLVSPALPPREKYPKALKLYRSVRKADPKHRVAAEKIKLIEDIYKSMKRPIPPG